MPPTNTTADRVMRRLGEVGYRATFSHWEGELTKKDMEHVYRVAAALSAHGLRELMAALELCHEKTVQDLPRDLDSIAEWNSRAEMMHVATTKALTALLGEGE